MRFFNYIEKLLSSGSNSTANSSASLLQDTLNTMRRYKRAGQYDAALKSLEQLNELMPGMTNKTLSIMVQLHRADIYIAQKRWEDAHDLLAKLKHVSELDNQSIHLAYIYVAMGTLSQSKNEWDLARQYYENAIELARKVKALGAEGRAQGHLADTYLHENNASFAAYLLQETLPKLNRSGDFELSSYFVGRLGESMIAMNKKEEGLRLIGGALRLSEQMGHLQYEIKWRRILAQHALTSDLYDEAKRHLLKVVEYIKPNLKDSIVDLCYLSKIEHHLGNKDAMLDYAGKAIEFSKEFEDDSEVKSLALLNMGIVLQVIGRAAESIPYLESEFNWDASLDLYPPFKYVDILRHTGTAFMQVEDYQSALNVYQKALDIIDPLDIGDIHRDIGILHLRQDNQKLAIQSWQTALHIYEENQQHTQAARLYCDLANLRRAIGQIKLAMKDYSQALMLLSSVKDERVRGFILANAATAYVDQGDIETAESFFAESIQIAKRFNDYPAEATRQGNYGWFLLSTGRVKQALTTLHEALQLSKNLDLSLQIAIQTDNIGLVHDELGDFDKALLFHQQAIDLLPEAHARWQGVFCANQGHTLIALGNIQNATALFNRALEIGRNTGGVEVIIRALTGQAKAIFQQEEVIAAKEIINEAVQLSKQAGLRRLLAESLVLRSKYYARIGELDNAADDWVSASKILGVLRIVTDQRTPSWLEMNKLE